MAKNTSEQAKAKNNSAPAVAKRPQRSSSYSSKSTDNKSDKKK